VVRAIPAARADRPPRGLHTPEARDDVVVDDQTDQKEMVRAFLDALATHRHHMDEALRDSWSDVEEAMFAYGATTLDVKAQTENAERIDFVWAYAGVASGNAGLVELGTYTQLLVPAGPPGLFLSTKTRLWNTDKRRLSSVTLTANVPGAPGSGPAGFLSLALWGKEIPQGRLRW
jgi:hypothetical protein